MRVGKVIKLRPVLLNRAPKHSLFDIQACAAFNTDCDCIKCLFTYLL